MCQWTGLLLPLSQNNTFILSSRWLPHMVLDQTNTWIMRETIQPHLLFRSVHILLDHYEPQTPNKTPLELASLLSCTKLDRLDIEICTPEILANDPEGIKKRSVKEAMAGTFYLPHSCPMGRQTCLKSCLLLRHVSRLRIPREIVMLTPKLSSRSCDSPIDGEVRSGIESVDWRPRFRYPGKGRHYLDVGQAEWGVGQGRVKWKGD